MFETICALPLSSELFTQAIHPHEPIIAVGLSGGHVQSFRLPTGPPGSDDGDCDRSVLSVGTGAIETEWRTRRHKGSCRCLGFSLDGEVLYSAGTDSLLKAASSHTGQVQSKLAIPSTPSNSQPDPPTLLCAPSPQTLLLATDSSALHLYDLRSPSIFASSRPAQTHHPHDDYISSLTLLPPTEASTSGFSKQWVTTGGTTLAVTDLRRGVLVKSEDQEEELLSSIFVGGLPARPGRSKGEKVLIGSSNGVLTLWERGVWDDQDERIIVDGGRAGGESLDALAVIPSGVGGGGKHVVVGVGDGTIRVVQLGLNKVIGEPLRHDEVEGVVGLGFDVHGRMISGGGRMVKVWQEEMRQGDDEGEEIGDDDDEEDHSGEETYSMGRKRPDSLDEDEDSDDRPRHKKRKGKKGKKKGSSNGVIGFNGLD